MGQFQIFISYRREGGDILAGRIADRLKALGYNVFYDVETMTSGRFDSQIIDAISGVNDVLLVLPKNALDRCVNEDDWVRKEIAAALMLGKNIIPVMTHDFVFPAVLPDDIDEVRNWEGIKLPQDASYFDDAMNHIRRLLKSNATEGSSADKMLDNGVRFIKNRLYKKAVEAFDSALDCDMSNPDIHFYMAIALFEGKRPFLCPKSKITQIEEHLNIAEAIAEKAVYFYLHAYVKKDFYESKALRAVPSSAELLAKARMKGLDPHDAEEMFALLAVERPEGF